MLMTFMTLHGRVKDFENLHLCAQKRVKKNQRLCYLKEISHFFLKSIQYEIFFVVKNPSHHSFYLLQMMMIDGRLETELEKIMAIDVDLIERRCFSTWVDT